MTDPVPMLPTKEEFSSELNSLFRAHHADGSEFDLTLLEANSSITSPVQECFSLLFRAPADAGPVQDMFSLANERLGQMDLFLVPVKRDEDGLYYEAVFNNIVSS